jgi:PTS system nitrogen regulatory IIA component
VVRLADLTAPELVFPRLPGADAATLLAELAARLAPRLAGIDAARIYERLMERERLSSTGVGAGVAIPHCKLESLKRPVLAVGIADRPVDFGAADGQPVQVLFVVVSPPGAPAEHLQTLSAIARWLQDPQAVEALRGTDDREAIYAALAAGGPS